jgi:hypothetical protein
MRDDVRRALGLARAMILLAVMLGGLMLFLWVAAPGFSGGQPWFEAPLRWAGLAGYLFGIAWMIRIYRSRPETSRSTWRSRDRSPDPVPGWSRNGHTPASGENRATRVVGTMREDVARAQGLARAMITLVVFLGVLMLFLWIAAPGHMGSGEPPWYATPLPGTGMYLLGLAWMVRIYLSRPETSRTDWRYRSER